MHICIIEWWWSCKHILSSIYGVYFRIGTSILFEWNQNALNLNVQLDLLQSGKNAQGKHLRNGKDFIHQGFLIDICVYTGAPWQLFKAASEIPDSGPPFRGNGAQLWGCANSTAALPRYTNLNTSCIMPHRTSVIPAILSGILCGRRDTICMEKSDLMSVVQGRNAIRELYINCQVVPQAFCLVIVNRPILT